MHKFFLAVLLVFAPDIFAAGLAGAHYQEVWKPLSGTGGWGLFFIAYLICVGCQFAFQKLFMEGEQGIPEIFGYALWWLPLGGGIVIALK
jgi:hypothetical protein